MASAHDNAEENHWPGYVDALTTMLMVLTFVMMILGIAVFAMSQNVSRILVESIAKAARVEPKGADEPVPELTQRIVDKLVLDQAGGGASAGRSAGDAAVPAEGLRGAEAAAALDATQRLMSEQSAAPAPSPAPVKLETVGEGLVIAFQPRATALDEAANAGLAAALGDPARFREADVVEIRPVVDRTAAGLSDARRIAFYRAMLVRSAMLKAGIAAGQIRVRVDEQAVTDGAGREVVRIVPIRAAR